MKARVYVSLKSTVLDPQGSTIGNALRSLGHASIVDVRQGKFFDIALNAANKADAAAELERISSEILSNPVIEEYRVEVLD